MGIEAHHALEAQLGQPSSSLHPGHLPSPGFVLGLFGFTRFVQGLPVADPSGGPLCLPSTVRVQESAEAAMVFS